MIYLFLESTCSQYFLIFTPRLKFDVELSKASNALQMNGSRNNVYGTKRFYCQCIVAYIA